MKGSRRVVLLVGADYQHRNGCTYRCLECRSDSSFVVRSPKGWTCIAHNVWQQEDGLIWWDYSVDGHFERANYGEW